MKTLVAIDPGQRSGVAVFKYDETSVKLVSAEEVYGGMEGLHSWLCKHAPEFETIFVIEDFILDAWKHSVDLTPVFVIGMVWGWCKTWVGVTLVKQSPAGRKEAVPDDALKHAGWYFAGEPQRNIKESVRHGAWWLKNQHHRPTIEKLFGGPSSD